MIKPTRSYRPFVTLLLLSAPGAFPATYTVSKDGRGAFSTIQAAVDRAGRNDVVEILDAAVYPEQVTLDSAKSGLTLRSANPASPQKPTIRFQDVVNQGPKTCQEALDAAKITYDRNGALRLLEVDNVTLEGLAVDGGGPSPFEWPNVWGNGVDCNGMLFPLFHGNAALVVHHSARATVRECVFRNAFFGVDVNEGSATGAFAIPAGASALPPVARPGFGGMGGHLFENNLFAGNTAGLSGQKLYGLPSTFRNNRFFENGHATYGAARAVQRMRDGVHHVGSAVFMKGDPFCPWFFEHNTFLANYLIFNGNYQPGSNHLVQANLFGPPSRYWGADSIFPNPFQELLPYLWSGLRRNLVAAQVRSPEASVCSLSFSAFDSVAAATVTYDSLATACGAIRLLNSLPAPEIRPDTVRTELVSGDRRLPAAVVVPRSPPFAPILDTLMGIEPSRRQGNRWWEPRFASLEPAAGAFLVPEWPVHLPQDLRPADGDYRNGGDEAALPGRIPPEDQAPTVLRVTPLEPVREVGGDLELTFEVEARGPVSGLTVAGVIPVEMAALRMDAFGGSNLLKGNGKFHASSLPVAALSAGFNRLRVPKPWASGTLGMVHLLLRGRIAGGGPGFSNWTSFPAGIYRQDIRIAVNGDSGSGPLDAPADGRILVALSGLPDSSTGRNIRLARLSGLPLDYLDPGRVESGWLVAPAQPVEVRLSGSPADLRYDALVAYSAPVSQGNPPALSGLSPLLRFPGASVGTIQPKPRRSPVRKPAASRDALGRLRDPLRHRTPAVPAYSPPGDRIVP